MNGKTVVVTGGAGAGMTGRGDGMGLALVRGFHDAGARVVACDLDEERVAALQAQLPDVVAVVADVSKPEDCDRLIEAAGRVDVLCNHAGTAERLGPLEDVNEADWLRVLGVNLTGPYMLCRRVVPGMVAQGGGVIINTASVAGMRGARGGPAYTASKWGLIGLTQNIAATYGSAGIRCNAICPGPMGTRSLADRIAAATPRGAQMLSRDRDKPEPCDPELVASLALFLASDAAARINGAAIPVDGGWIAY
jgi:NAD(P)-dependent dehydrogenase (short-subunit alcohol dehydrogenase family)